MYVIDGQDKEIEVYRIKEQVKELETWRDMIAKGEQSKCDVRSEVDILDDAINTIKTLSAKIQSQNFPKTNEDRIRSMTDVELADIIMCPHNMPEPLPPMCEDKTCLVCTIEWLKEECE